MRVLFSKGSSQTFLSDTECCDYCVHCNFKLVRKYIFSNKCVCMAQFFAVLRTLFAVKSISLFQN